MMPTVTKTRATELARRTLSTGHQSHADGATARCPICAEHCRRTDVVLYADDRGKLKHGDMVRQLARAVVDCSADDREHER